MYHDIVKDYILADSYQKCVCFIHSCKIDWKKGKNLTVKTVKKKQRHKG